jgi:hypothetical protein
VKNIYIPELSRIGRSLDYPLEGQNREAKIDVLNSRRTKTMQYLLLIYDNEANWGKLSEAEQGAMYKEYGEFTESIMKSGHHLAGKQLQPISTASTVRVRDKKRVVTDGPYAETKEQLGGFYMIEAKDLDDAIAVAARIPSARFGSIEVRPIVARERL